MKFDDGIEELSKRRKIFDSPFDRLGKVDFCGAVVAIAGAAATVYSAYSSSEASEDAAETQSDAARYAGDLQAQAQAESTDLQREIFEKGVEERAPFLEAGTKAIGELEKRVFEGPGDFEAGPGYEFRVSEGIRSREQGAAARGKVFSGQQAKALTEFGQNIASQEYDKFLSQYYQSLTPFQSLAGVGQTTVGQSGAAGEAYAGAVTGITQTGADNIGASFQNVADVNAANTINQANIASGTISDLAGIYGTYRARQQKPLPQIDQRVSGDNFQTSQYRVA